MRGWWCWWWRGGKFCGVGGVGGGVVVNFAGLVVLVVMMNIPTIFNFMVGLVFIKISEDIQS